ncbi:hypothetical protein VNO77_16542 [Canavalia gladiata]|uniref:Uncharacterized protein n=1 Tax=Canavalia gladiata TaxID=3824 RepID=A0AAN9M1X3_CANGL
MQKPFEHKTSLAHGHYARQLNATETSNRETEEGDSYNGLGELHLSNECASDADNYEGAILIDSDCIFITNELQMHSVWVSCQNTLRPVFSWEHSLNEMHLILHKSKAFRHLLHNVINQGTIKFRVCMSSSIIPPALPYCTTASLCPINAHKILE